MASSRAPNPNQLATSLPGLTTHVSFFDNRGDLQYPGFRAHTILDHRP